MTPKQALNLLKQTVVKSPDGKIGTVLSFGISHNAPFFSGYAVQFENEKTAKFIPCIKMEKYTLV